jgi:antitoxin component YwqK of YwqJK toxin-antitoxin module
MTHSSSNCIDPIKKNNRGGLVYLVNETKPFSGKFCKTEVSSELNYKDGKKDGVHISYFRSGQKEEEGNYKDGKKTSFIVMRLKKIGINPKKWYFVIFTVVIIFFLNQIH